MMLPKLVRGLSFYYDLGLQRRATSEHLTYAAASLSSLMALMNAVSSGTPMEYNPLVASHNISTPNAFLLLPLLSAKEMHAFSLAIALSRFL